MSTRLLCAMLLGLWVGSLGCGTNPNLRAHRRDDGRLEVEGALAGPFKTREELATKACDIITSQGGATGGNDGSEYCALHYYSPSENAYYLSYLSDIKERLDTRTKSCSLPLLLNDPQHLDALIIGGDHGHPHNRQFSPKDLRISWHPTHAVDKASGKVFQRELWLFFREKSGECRTYSFNLVTRVISALRDEQWEPIGQSSDDHGNIQMFEGKDWLP
jgi:hypothetical protein